MIALKCKNCKKSFRVRNYRKNTAHFCSKVCAYTDKERAKKQSERIKSKPIPNSENNRYQKGHIQLMEVREKMKGKRPNAKPWNKKPDVFINCLQCNKKVKIKPVHLGKQKFCSKKCADTFRDKGKTSEVRKLRSSLEYRLWREAVFKRDNWTCIWCDKRGGNLNADHIKRFADYPELRFAIDNGRTLCVPCHKKTGTYGRGAIYRQRTIVAV